MSFHPQIRTPRRPRGDAKTREGCGHRRQALRQEPGPGPGRRSPRDNQKEAPLPRIDEDGASTKRAPEDCEVAAPAGIQVEFRRGVLAGPYAQMPALAPAPQHDGRRSLGQASATAWAEASNVSGGNQPRQIQRARTSGRSQSSEEGSGDGPAAGSGSRASPGSSSPQKG